VARTLDGRRFGPPLLDYTGALVLPSLPEASLVIMPPMRPEVPVLGWPVRLDAAAVAIVLDPHVCTTFGLQGEVDELRFILN
jgi:hypothetical protein